MKLTRVGQGRFPNMSLSYWLRHTFEVGSMGWGVLTNGGGTSAAIVDETGHRGMFRTSITSSAVVDFQSSSTFSLSSLRWKHRFLIRIPTLSNSTDRFTVDVGLSDSLFTATGNYIGFRYIDNVNTGNWQVVSSAGTESTVNSSTAPTANTWNDCSFEINSAASNVRYVMNGVVLGNITTNIPTVALTPTIRITKSSGSNARTVDIDDYYVENSS